VTDLPVDVTRQSTQKKVAPDVDYNLKTLEIRTIRRALEKAGGNKAEAAKLLGIYTTTVYRKMAKYDMLET
jgi:transcriptional regulator with PAS, ATPase and Fis domain